MNFPFNVKFAIFDENKEITKNQTKLRKKLIWVDIRDIIKEIFNNDKYR